MGVLYSLFLIYKPPPFFERKEQEMTYSFDIDVAKEYGVNEAILITNLQFWIRKNQANDKNFYDGRYWTYNSIKAWQELFPFWTEKTIRTIINHLIEKGIIMTSNYNQSKYDRTLWYAFVDESIWLNGKIHLPKRENGNDEMGKPIPDNKPDNKLDSIYTYATAKKFTKPTLEQVKQYCLERNNNVDCERFINYYESNGWKVGRSQMKDWKAAVRNWERSSFNQPAHSNEFHGI